MKKCQSGLFHPRYPLFSSKSIWKTQNTNTLKLPERRENNVCFNMSSFIPVYSRSWSKERASSCWKKLRTIYWIGSIWIWIVLSPMSISMVTYPRMKDHEKVRLLSTVSSLKEVMMFCIYCGHFILFEKSSKTDSGREGQIGFVRTLMKKLKGRLLHLSLTFLDRSLCLKHDSHINPLIGLSISFSTLSKALADKPPVLQKRDYFCTTLFWYERWCLVRLHGW